MASRLSRLAARRRPELLVAGTVAAVAVGLTAVAASLVVAVATLAGLLGPGAGVGLLLALLLVTVAAGLGTAAGAAGIAWTAVGRLRAATGRARRRVSWAAYRRARRLEAETGLGRLLRPARLFEGRSEGDPLLTELKTRYVAGEIDEFEYERELARLLGGDDPGRARRSVEVTAPDGGPDAEGADDEDGRDLDEGPDADDEAGADPEGVERGPDVEGGTGAVDRQREAETE